MAAGDDMKVLMVGASGPVAGLVLPALLARGVEVRALVRDRRGAELAAARGAHETVIGDLGDIDSLQRAASGVEGVFHINPAFAPDEAAMGVAMVLAAQRAGARKFVFSGVYHPTINAMVNHRAKQPVEEALFESPLAFTILQPSMFMQNLSGAVAGARRSGQIAMPYSVHARTAWVDYRDVAEVAALAMTSDDLDYGTFELSAPGMVDRVQMAEMMQRAIGRDVEALEIPRERWAAQLPEGPLREGLTRMMEHYDRYGFAGGNALVLRSILGREPRTLQDYFLELAGGLT